MQQPGSFMNVHFCTPGQYQVNLHVHFVSPFGQQNQHLQMGIPYQQQMPSLGYGQTHQFGSTQFGSTQAPLNGNGQVFPRVESNNSILDSSYSSGLSTPGIASNSWSYTTPQDFNPHPPRNMNNGFFNKNNQQKHFSFTSDDSFNPHRKSEGLPASSTPTKTGGCFSKRNCNVM